MLFKTVWAQAQETDPRWSLLPDSTVKGIHYRQLAHMEGVRRLYLGQRNAFRMEAIACGRQVSALSQLVDNYKQTEIDLIKNLDVVTDDNFRLERLNREANRKVDKLRPWATVGRISTYTLAVGVTAFGIGSAIRAINGR